jgi:hypothetical protein
MSWQTVSKQREDQEKNGEMTLKTPCNNMVYLITMQQDKQESSKHLDTRHWGTAALTKSGNRVKERLQQVQLLIIENVRRKNPFRITKFPR